MALDTAAKRKSALEFGYIGWPVPTGVVAQADRQHTVGSYGGILAAGAVVVSIGPILRSTPALLPEPLSSVVLLPSIEDVQEL